MIEETLPNTETSEDMETLEETVVKQDSPTRNVSKSYDGKNAPAPRILLNIQTKYPQDYEFETILIFCAKNKKEVMKQSKQNFAKAQFLGQRSNVSQSPNHFAFQILLKSNDLTLLERDAKKLNKDVKLIEYFVLAAKETITTGQHHCKDCHIKNNC